MIVVGVLVVVGIGLVLAGVGHVLLPRVLGWTEHSGHADGAMSALVIRLHVGFIGAYLALTGLVTLVAAPDLAAGGRFAAVFCLGNAALFGARTVGEITSVGRALRDSPELSVWWNRVHLVAMIMIWPGLTVVYAVGGLRALA